MGSKKDSNQIFSRNQINDKCNIAMLSGFVTNSNMNSFVKGQCNAEFLIAGNAVFWSWKFGPDQFQSTILAENILHNLDMERLGSGTDRYLLESLPGNPDIETFQSTDYYM